MAAGNQPGQTQLRWCHLRLVLLGECFELVGKFKVLCQIFTLQTIHVTTNVTFWQIIDGLNVTGENALSSGRVGQDGDLLR